MRWIAICGCLSTASAFFAGVGVQAQEAASEELARQETITVEDRAEILAEDSAVVSKIPMPLLETPASVSVVTAATIEERDARVMGEALVNVPGATVQPSSGVFDIFVIRGYDSLNTGLVLMQQVAEPESTFYQLYNVERMDVLRGPGSHVYGATPMTGAINLVRKTPGTDVLDVSLSAGSFATYRAMVDYGSGSEDDGFAFRVNGLYGQSDGYRDRTDWETWGINPTLQWWIAEESSLLLDVEYLSNDYKPDAGVPVRDDSDFGVPRTQSYASPFDTSDQEVTRVRLDWEGGTIGRWGLRNRLYFTDLEWQSRGTVFFGTFPLPEETVIRTLAGLDNQQTALGTQFEATRFSDRNDLMIGAEISRRTDEFTIDIGVVPTIAVYDPVETATELPPPIEDFGQRGDARSDQIAPYVMDRFMPTERLSLLVGGRLDTLDYRDPVNGVSRDDTEFSPFLGVNWLFGEALSVYGQYSEGFSAPSSRVFEDRKPEESQQIEAGLKGQWLSGRLFANLAVYELSVDNLAIFDDNGVTAQLGNQRSRGVEFELIGSPARGWRYHVAYGYTDAVLTRFTEAIQVGFFPPEFVTIDRSGNRPGFAPEHAADAWFARYYENGFGWGAGARYISEQFIAEDNVFLIDSVTTVEAMLTYRWQNYRFSLNGRNLTDESYFRRGFGGTSVIPADGRSVSFTVKFTR